MQTDIVSDTYAAKMEEAIKALKEAFQKLGEVIEPIWNDIVELFKAMEDSKVKCYDHEYIRASWSVPPKIAFTNQVMNRKPVVCRARSYL